VPCSVSLFLSLCASLGFVIVRIVGRHAPLALCSGSLALIPFNGLGSAAPAARPRQRAWRAPAALPHREFGLFAGRGREESDERHLSGPNPHLALMPITPTEPLCHHSTA
jgi:hypothetical protein